MYSSASKSISKSSFVSVKKQHFHNQIRTEALNKYMRQLRDELIYQQDFQNLLKITEQSQNTITNENLNKLIYYANNSNDYAITHLSLLILNGIIPISVCQQLKLTFKDSFAWLNFFRVCVERQFCTIEMIQASLVFLGKSKLQQNILSLTSCLQFLKILIKKGNEKVLESLTEDKLLLKLISLTAFNQIKISNLSFSIMDLLFQSSQITNKIIPILQIQSSRLKQMLNIGLNNDCHCRKTIKMMNNIISSGYLNMIYPLMQKVISLIFKLTANIWNDQMVTQQSLLIVIQFLYLIQTIFQNSTVEVITYYADIGIVSILLYNIKFYLSIKPSLSSSLFFEKQSIYSLRLKACSMIQSRFKELIQKIMSHNQDYMKVIITQIKKYNLINYFYDQFQFGKQEKSYGFQLQI